MSNFKSALLRRKSQIRSAVLKQILNFGGFRIIRDHWLYTKSINKDSVVIDLGANTGTFSDIMLSNFNSRCYAIEPNIQLFNSLNNPKLIKYNYAVTDKDGPLEFYISENHEASSIMNNFQQLWNVAEKKTVAGISWNSLIRELRLQDKEIDVVKIDIEGAEIELLNSLSEENLDNIKQITVEFHHRLNKNLHNTTVSVIKKLLSCGFTGIANTITPTEILFLNSKYYTFSPSQKFLLAAYKKLRFSMH